MACPDLEIKMEPILTGVNWPTLHESLKHFRRICTGALGPANLRQCPAIVYVPGLH